MRICQTCSQEFEDEAGTTAGPAEVLGQIFLASVGGDDPGTQDAQDFCPACREKLGIVNIL